MKNLKALLVGAAGIAVSATVFGGANESANLSVTIAAGALEIDPASIAGTHAPVTGAALSITGAAQVDAIVFNIDGIAINDLNGDDLGWVLTAVPGDLANGADEITVGTTAGFNNPSDAGNTTIDNANQVTYTSGTGISGYTIDYDVAYTVPAFTAAGTYTGTVAFAIVAN